MVQVAVLIAYHAAGFLIIMQRGSTSSYSGVIVNHAGGLHHHAAGLIAYQVAGLIAYQVAVL